MRGIALFRYTEVGANSNRRRSVAALGCGALSKEWMNRSNHIDSCRHLVLAGVLGFVMSAVPFAHGQGISDRPVRIILAQTVGTTPDLIGRTLAPRLQARWISLSSWRTAPAHRARLAWTQLLSRRRSYLKVIKPGCAHREGADPIVLTHLLDGRQDLIDRLKQAWLDGYERLLRRSGNFRR
jgi:hypothetical protein